MSDEPESVGPGRFFLKRLDLGVLELDHASGPDVDQMVVVGLDS